jgi:hypothetical protein
MIDPDAFRRLMRALCDDGSGSEGWRALKPGVKRNLAAIEEHNAKPLNGKAWMPAVEALTGGTK